MAAAAASTSTRSKSNAIQAVAAWQIGVALLYLSLSRLRTEWFGNIHRDILAGLVVALALIPEAIAFSIIAGVDPKVGH